MAVIPKKSLKQSDAVVTNSNILEYKELVLQQHDDSTNTHKYYAIYPNEEPGKTACRYGRVGRSQTETIIPFHETWKKYSEKIKKGYYLTGAAMPNEPGFILQNLLTLINEDECELPD
jgi:predicted DNA-binding WGR domain protein